MDMKKILQAFDGAATKPVQGANDMKKFMSIVRENANPYKTVEENVVTSFEEGSVGGDANAFLIAADTINDEVMGQIDKIKINADPQLLKNLMSKFNEFMSAYHAVGKEILQPDMFDELPGDATSRDNTDESVAEEIGSTTATLDAVFNEHDFYRLEHIWPALEAGDKQEALRQINHYLTRGKNRAWWGDLQALDIKIDTNDVENSQVVWSKPVQQGVEEAVGEIPDFVARRKGKKPADLGSSDAWYHRAMSPTYYGFEKGTPEYAEYVKAYDEWDEGPRGGKQWESIDKGLSFKDYVNLQEAKQGLK